MSVHDRSFSDTDLEVAEITKCVDSAQLNCENPMDSQPTRVPRRGRGRGQWLENIKRQEEQKQLLLGNGLTSQKVNDLPPFNISTPTQSTEFLPQKVLRNRHCQFEDAPEEKQTIERLKYDKEKGVEIQKIRRPSPEFKVDEMKTSQPKEIYIPEKDLTGDALFEDRKNKRYRTGLNFDAYEDISCDVTGDRAIKSKIQSFNDLGLNPTILRNIIKMEYKKPTPIQKHATPHIMNGIDIMACAQTGSGKTAGFLLPIINALLKKDLPFHRHGLPVQPSCLVLAPTRELAKQIYTEANMYSSDTIIINCCIYGGVAMFHQKSSLRKGCHILIATPGRLLQFVEENLISLNKVTYFVLDEADRMLDMGFMPEVRRIVKELPPKSERVSAMFSATFPRAIQNAAADYLENYVFVTIGTVGGACVDIQQIIYRVERADKRRKLREVFNDIFEREKVLIFCAKKQSADFLAAHLAGEQISTTSIHGDRLQSQRELALKEFTEGIRQVLVATSVASRGLDIPKVSVVINFDLPDSIDDYVHRIGRTGRVGHVGKAISFFDQSTDAVLAPQLVRILRNANQEVPDWLNQQGGPDDDGRFPNRRRFGATDHRMRNRKGFTGISTVPDAIEVDDDDWGQ